MTRLAPDERLAALIRSVDEDAARAHAHVDAAIAEFPADARLHFLKGSVLAGEGDYAAARLAMRRAVDIAPDYHVARFQLGFLLLTSGEPRLAQETWGPLLSLPAHHCLHLFVRGLAAMIGNDFAGAIRLLLEGMANNPENPVLNKDMQLVVDTLRDASEPSSPVAQLLRQSALNPTRH